MMTGKATASVETSVTGGWGGLVRYSILALCGALMMVSLYLIFIWVPTEQNLGIVQRVFYFHVPLGWIGILSILVVATASAAYLITGSEKWDALAYSAAEVGVLFASLILITGSIWAKPIWGVWWTWDARLTTTLILWFIYVAYLMLSAYAPQGTQGVRYAAVFGIIGAIDAPIVYFATVWWRTAHPDLNIGPLAEKGSLESSMLLTLMVAVAAFTLLFIYLLAERYSLRRAEADLDRLYQSRV